jgi:hypothetical protein
MNTKLDSGRGAAAGDISVFPGNGAGADVFRNRQNRLLSDSPAAGKTDIAGAIRTHDLEIRPTAAVEPDKRLTSPPWTG